ncbi:DUF998 domain-containing protein [Glaciihabitans sp. dw_435]|uniref:DUF998 domain-containing protein n=1 Tax=Glaciihabitans sp. dw_435 TaxID=2720081 RepID=UPI001BD62625|nr:DUF998 domain-containing protein [Glaciihabitans sp. dw_435]
MPSVVARKPALIAAVLWVVAGVIYFGAEAISASVYPGYSYATNYISDLGVPDVEVFQGRTIDSPLAWLMNSAFIAQGLLFLAAAILATRAIRVGPRRWFLAVATVHTVGIILVGLFNGSQRNAENHLLILHVLGAALAIVAGNLAAITAGIGSARIGAARWYRVISIVLGVVGILSLVMLLVDSGSSTLNLLPDGVWERASVYAITGWEIFTAVCLITWLRRAPRERSTGRVA